MSNDVQDSKIGRLIRRYNDVHKEIESTHRSLEIASRELTIFADALSRHPERLRIQGDAVFLEDKPNQGGRQSVPDKPICSLETVDSRSLIDSVLALQRAIECRDLMEVSLRDCGLEGIIHRLASAIENGEA